MLSETMFRNLFCNRKHEIMSSLYRSELLSILQQVYNKRQKYDLFYCFAYFAYGKVILPHIYIVLHRAKFCNSHLVTTNSFIFKL